MRTTPANPLLKDAKRQDPEAICALVPSNVNRNVMMNRDAAPFDKPELRRAVVLTIDRKAFVDTLTEGKGDFAMVPPPEGVWGMPADMLKNLPGYDPNLAKNRAEVRRSIAVSSGMVEDFQSSVAIVTQCNRRFQFRGVGSAAGLHQNPVPTADGLHHPLRITHHTRPILLPKGVQSGAL